MRKDGLVQSVWTLDGKVYVKTSLDGSPVRIYCLEDLDNLHNLFNICENKLVYRDGFVTEKGQRNTLNLTLFFFILLYLLFSIRV